MTEHTATYTPAGGGWFLVTCPHGCNLGTTRQRADRESAERRVELHRLATASPAGTHVQARRPA
jgi:hypothetical protein